MLWNRIIQVCDSAFEDPKAAVAIIAAVWIGLMLIFYPSRFEENLLVQIVVMSMQLITGVLILGLAAHFG